MRIIAGTLKNSTLHLPKNKNTRPLKDMVRESIFNFLMHSNKIPFQLEKSIVLDLFSGSGSFGLECLSRKVKHVTFVENYKPAIRTFYKNIQYLNNIKNYDLIEKDIFDIKIKKHLNKNFDLIFADPPYKEKRISSLFSIIEKNNFLNKNGLLILHRNKKTNDPLNDKFHIVNTRFYGISKIIFYKLK